MGNKEQVRRKREAKSTHTHTQRRKKGKESVQEGGATLSVGGFVF